MGRRTRRLLLLALPAVLALGLVAWLLWPRTAITTITEQNAEKIREGMTVAEVEAILGGPGRSESPGRFLPAMSNEQFREIAIRFRPAEPHSEWQSNQVRVLVRFDPEGRVQEWTCFPVRRESESPVDMLRRRLGL
jgi:hypothetical protein